ncbi:glycosyltransferase involved in cell wall biosynthesis [Rhodopseudomonas rhenobacensis]|uniref:Glycosyltransferase involved in cell wall biosynthesis n=1 Tax=Rhodopseudomonas rhenobacensis TaxID=87461 RepID=A0A7W7Z3A8_9BRAD|nr:glycosyltransferase family 4 protein [Rhodopseudomonas rhenobacensis]MBB5047186.1 glycosyltransferase involved in cell wall biosynthesis [Rhodopseudomonas rhenobacensis]
MTVNPAAPPFSAPMRIALLISGTGVNGVAMHCLLLVQYLLSRGHRVLLLHRPGAWIADRPGLDGAEKFVTSFGRSPGELIRVTKRLNAFKPEVLHTHMSSAHTYGMLARILSRRPVVATAHSTSLQLHWWFNNRVIATSPDAEAHHIKVNRVSRRAMRMIPSFIDTRSFPVIGDDERSAAREALGLPQDAFVIGCVGDICERKRQIDVVRALANVLKTEPKARLLLVGGRFKEYFDELTKVVDELGVASQLITTGSRNDVPALLAAMDAFVLASRKESSPLAVLEAMSRGLPVIASDVGMLSDFVAENVTGHVVQVGDVDAISRHLIALAADPERRKAMGDAAQATARTKYDMSVLAPQTEAVLREAAAIKNRPWLGFAAELCGTSPS